MNTATILRRRIRLARRNQLRLQVEPLEDRLTPALAAGTSVPGELLIGFQPGLTGSDVAAFYAAYGLSELKNLDAGPGKSIRLVSTRTQQSAALIPTLEHDPRVRYADPDDVMTAAQVPNDPAFSRDYGLLNTGQTGGTPDADIDADEAWNITTGSSNVVVADIDTGVDYTHPDLAANMWHNPGEIPGNHKDDDGNGLVDDYYGYDFANKDGDPMDGDGHGTHVAGIIGMVGNNATGSAGVNWNVKIMALQYIQSAATVSGNVKGDIAAAVSAIEYATMMRQLYESSGGALGANVRVINASWGYWDIVPPQALKDAIDASGEAGILFVAAAHNQARDNDVTPVYPASFDSPNIISVAATDHDDRYASFTDWGATSVDLAAPGDAVWSTWPGGGYQFSSGTSMATPLVAGAAALVWSASPNLTAAEVKARLLNSVDPIGQIGANANYPTVTNGRLNVRNALLYQPPDGESIAPAAVGNLSVATTTPWSASLAWTATGDDGATGRATSYDVRYSSTPITEANWAAATPAAGEPAPQAAGAAETVTVGGLDPGTQYYFALKVRDNDGNESALSNLAAGATGAATALLNDDAEAPTALWDATGMWHRSTLRGHDSPTAWYYGQDATGTFYNGTQHTGSLTLAAPINLTGVSQAKLRFNDWLQIADFPALETARVQVSRDGAAWATVWETLQSSLDWEPQAVDLTQFVGGPLYIRFSFNTNDNVAPPWAMSQGLEGWHVDDIRVLVPAAPPAGISVSDVTVSEGQDGTTPAVFTVTRTSGSGIAYVQFATADGSATAASGDYQPRSGTLTFAPGETSKTVTVLVNGDRLAEADEHFVLNLSNPTGATIADGQGVGTIRDDEPRIVVDGQVIFQEGDTQTTLQVAVNLSAPSSQPVTVSYATADGTAVAGSDYLPTSGTLTFAPGETRKVIPVTLARDRTQEAILEAFFINLSGVSSNAVILRHGVIHIVDDDKNHGNHWGYRNQNGAASGGWGIAAGRGGAVRAVNSPSDPANVSLVSTGSPAADSAWAVHFAQIQDDGNIHHVDFATKFGRDVAQPLVDGTTGGLTAETLAAGKWLAPLVDGESSWLAGPDESLIDTPPSDRRRV
jgi:subtilisin family serine protease